MIDFDNFPIYIWQPSQIDIDSIPPLADGLHYYVNFDCNHNLLTEIMNQLKAILHTCINEQNRPPAGLKYPIILDVDSTILNEFVLSDDVCDKLHKHGINTIRLKRINNTTQSLVPWGTSVIFKNRPFSISTTDHYDWKPNNLLYVAAEHKCTIPSNHNFPVENPTNLIDNLTKRKERLQQELNKVNQQLIQLTAKEYENSKRNH